MMRTRKQEAELVDYWASQHEEAVDEIMASLEFYDDQNRNVVTEQLAYLIDDANFLRKHARNLRVNPGYNY
jgi:ribosomal protein S15P/S13E